MNLSRFLKRKRFRKPSYVCYLFYFREALEKILRDYNMLAERLAINPLEMDGLQRVVDAIENRTPNREGEGGEWIVQEEPVLVLLHRYYDTYVLQYMCNAEENAMNLRALNADWSHYYSAVRHCNTQAFSKSHLFCASAKGKATEELRDLVENFVRLAGQNPDVGQRDAELGFGRLFYIDAQHFALSFPTEREQAACNFAVVHFLRLEMFRAKVEFYHRLFFESAKGVETLVNQKFPDSTFHALRQENNEGKLYQAIERSKGFYHLLTVSLSECAQMVSNVEVAAVNYRNVLEWQLKLKGEYALFDLLTQRNLSMLKEAESGFNRLQRMQESMAAGIAALESKVRSDFFSPALQSPQMLPELRVVDEVLYSDEAYRIDDEKENLLKRLFEGEGFIEVKSFSRGLGGSALYLVTPYDADAQKAPYVVKIGRSSSLQKEHKNYQQHIKERIHHRCARVEGEPIQVGNLACIKYTYISGARDFKVFYETSDVEKIESTLACLFREDGLGSLWGQKIERKPKRYIELYDAMLPPRFTLDNVMLKQQDGADFDLSSLLKAKPEGQELIGKSIWLKGCQVMEIDSKKIKLNLPNLHARVDLNLPKDALLEGISEGKHVDVTGNIIGTRKAFFHKQAETLFDESRFTAEQFCVEGTSLVNPLAFYNELLKKEGHIHLSRIHGDFNLCNLLVDEVGAPYLIDYEKVQGEGHTAFDFAKLETEIKTHILATKAEITLPKFIELEKLLLHNLQSRFAQPLPPDYFSPEQAKAYFVISKIRYYAIEKYDVDIEEYLHSLLFYSLSVLKYKNLDEKNPCYPKTKQLPFLAAAICCEHLRD